MTHEMKQAIKYAKETGCKDFYSRNAHYVVTEYGEITRKELFFGAPIEVIGWI